MLIDLKKEERKKDQMEKSQLLGGESPARGMKRASDDEEVEKNDLATILEIQQDNGYSNHLARRV